MNDDGEGTRRNVGRCEVARGRRREENRNQMRKEGNTHRNSVPPIPPTRSARYANAVAASCADRRRRGQGDVGECAAVTSAEEREEEAGRGSGDVGEPAVAVERDKEDGAGDRVLSL